MENSFYYELPDELRKFCPLSPDAEISASKYFEYLDSLGWQILDLNHVNLGYYVQKQPFTDVTLYVSPADVFFVNITSKYRTTDEARVLAGKILVAARVAELLNNICKKK